MSNLASRLMVAVVFVPGILALLYVVHPIGFFCLVLLSGLIAASELFGMTDPTDRVARSLGVLLAGVVSAGLYFFAANPKALLVLFIAVPLLGLLIPLFRLGDISTAAVRMGGYAFGPAYCAAPVAFLAVLRRDYSAGWVMLALALSWLSDTGGYFAGRAFGRRKLYPAVSPKKTIEGALGGIAGSTLGAVWGHFHFLKGLLPLSHAIVIGVFAGALGQTGDLVESLLKRSTGIKDSGGILPGHGGILDRIDATIFTGSAVYLYVILRG